MARLRRGSALLSLVFLACGGGDSPTPPEEGTAELRTTPDSLQLSDAQPTATIFLTTRPADRSLAWALKSKSPWLTVSADQGTVKGTTGLNVTLVVPPMQEPGEMSGHVDFLYALGTVTVPVTATVAQSPHLVYAPTSIVVPEGADTVTLTITNTGHGGVSWRGGSSVSWLTLVTATGFVGTQQSVAVPIAVRRASLPAGTSRGSIGILSGVEAVSTEIPVTVTIASPP